MADNAFAAMYPLSAPSFHRPRGDMENERRYDDEEVHRIFDAATEAETSVPPPKLRREGLTLAELRTIASEVGLSPDLVSRAALALDDVEPGAGGRSLAVEGEARFTPTLAGIPLGVQREERLPRNLTEGEWGRLVMDLRRTFSARGQADAIGAAREWRNGNLFVAVAPAEDGARLTMGTRKGDAGSLAGGSMFLLMFAAVFLVLLALTGKLDNSGAAIVPAIFALLGVGGLAWNAIQLPAWAQTRARQFEEIGAKALAMTAGRADVSGAADAADAARH